MPDYVARFEVRDLEQTGQICLALYVKADDSAPLHIVRLTAEQFKAADTDLDPHERPIFEKLLAEGKMQL